MPETIQPPRPAAGAQRRLQGSLRAELFKALGDPTRLEVLSRLACARRPLRVSEIQGCCGIHLSGVSRHLSQLRRVGVVRSRRSGREVLYELDSSAVTAALRELADAFEGCCPTDPQEKM